MKKVSILFLISVLTLTVFAQKKSKVLLTIDDTKVNTDEFLRIYNKNSGMNTEENKSIDEYLDLFINFKLKVIEAEKQGYQNDENFVRELNGYKLELAKPYMNDPGRIKELVKEAYERSKYFIYASHLLVKVDKNAVPADTLEAYNKIMKLRERIINGEDFGTVALELNFGRYGGKTDGKLGWFTVFRMVYPFETGAYNTPVGEVSMPIRSEYGYHLIKVHEKKENKGEVKAAHIMISIPRGASDEVIQEKKIIIDSCYNLLKEGESFETVAAKCSEHQASKNKGGEIGYVNYNNAPQEFINAAYALGKIGDISEPVQTKYGWHIIKLIDKKDFPSFDEIKEKYEKEVAKDTRRTAATDQLVINAIKEKYGFSENLEYLKPVIELLDSSVYEGTWEAKGSEKLHANLFSIGDETYTNRDLAEYMALLTKPFRTKSFEKFTYNAYTSFSESKIKDYSVKMLEKENQEFGLIVKEYHDGILLFNLTNDMVWNKAIEDSAGLQNFYNQNKGKYMWEQRAQAAMYTISDSLMVDKLLPLAKERKEKNYTEKEIREIVCDTTKANCLSFASRKLEKGDDDIIDSLKWEAGQYKIITSGKRTYIYYIEDILDEEAKTLEESRGLYTADYQNFLEEKWIKDLRSKYKIEVNEKVLDKLKKENN